MKKKDDIIIILDSVLDDYYLLWECFSEYKEIKQNDINLIATFSQSLQEAYDLKYLNFYKGINFNGDEVELISFDLNDSLIEKLLDWRYNSIIEIRIRTSKLGIDFLNQLTY
jgi:hypothetical protein